MAKRVASANRIDLSTEAKALRMADRLRRYYSLGKEAGKSDSPTKDFADGHHVSEHLLRKLKRFAAEYSKRDLDALAKTLRPNGLPLQWGHVNYLLTIANKRQRQRMQKQAVANGWTAPQLARAITKTRERVSGHGRPMQRPATLEAGLEQLMAEATMWVRRCEVVVIDLRSRFDGRPSADLRRQAKEAAEVLGKVQRMAAGATRAIARTLLGRTRS